jgi:TetR/AcrR family tetracycline transcriptional repressor
VPTELSRQVILDIAIEVIRREGPDGLTMRSLCRELGTTAPTIYWHVGNKEQLLDGVTSLIGKEIGRVRLRGSAPEARIVSAGLSLDASLRRNQHLATFAYRRGALFDLLAPARRVLAEEFTAASLAPKAVVHGTNAVIKLVGDHRIALSISRNYPRQRAGVALWESEAPVAAETVRGLHVRYDPQRTFTFTLEALVAGLLQSARHTASP